MRSREKSPPTMTSAKGRWVSVPTPVASAAGSSPSAATSAVIMIGRNRRRAASRVASAIAKPADPQLVRRGDIDNRGLHRHAEERKESDPG